MPRILDPVRIPVPGNKLIEEFWGNASTQSDSASVAHMIAPPGWAEPFQAPTFDELTIVLRGRMRVTSAEGELEVTAGSVVLCEAGERVQYSNPFPEESEYWAICVPAFRLDRAQREES